MVVTSGRNSVFVMKVADFGSRNYQIPMVTGVGDNNVLVANVFGSGWTRTI